MSGIINSVGLNPDFEVRVWVDHPVKTIRELINIGYSKAIIAKINFLKPEPPYHIQSAIARESVETRYANFPAAADILRLYLLKTFGGL